MRKCMIVGLSLLLAPITGACFTAQFDGDADAVFFCQADEDCQEGQVCSALNRCLNDPGPSLTIKGPESLQLIQYVGVPQITMSLVGSDLKLVAQGQGVVEGEGYVELRLNGVLLETFSEGDLGAGLTHNSAPGVLAQAGIQRLTARAYRADGTPYENPSASTQQLFWLDDGEPHVAVKNLYPGESLPAGDDIEVEVVTINFDLIDPESDSDFDPLDRLQRGHVHIYANKGDLRDCLPGCNSSYEVTAWPDDGVPRNSASGTIDNVPGVAGDFKVSVMLNYTDHIPYPAETLESTIWGTGFYDDDLAIDEVTVSLIE